MNAFSLKNVFKPQFTWDHSAPVEINEKNRKNAPRIPANYTFRRDLYG